MYTCLQKLRFIEVIDFTVTKIDRETAGKIVKTLKDLRRNVELIVDVDSEKYLSLAIAYSKGADTALKVNHQTRPVVTIDHKTAMKASWYELKLHYQDFKLLVTGGVYGRREEEKVDGFLGSSRVPTHLAKLTDWIVISPISPVPVKKDTRLLQSFRNKASMFKWAFKSKRFVDLGFETEAPLLLYQHRQIDYYSIASFLLHCGSCGSITHSQLKDARRMLEQIDYCKYLGINKTASDPQILKAVQESEKLGRARKWMLQLILEPNRSNNATNEDLIMLYKSFLYPKVASINNKRVEKLQLAYC